MFQKDVECSLMEHQVLSLMFLNETELIQSEVSLGPCKIKIRIIFIILILQGKYNTSDYKSCWNNELASYLYLRLIIDIIPVMKISSQI